MNNRLLRLAIRLRKRMPWFDRWLSRLLESESFFASRIKALLVGYEQVPLPVLADEGAPVRLLIAPFNYASQGYQWAQSLDRTSAVVSARSYAVTSGLTFPAHVHIPATVFVGSEEWKNHLTEALPTYTHVLIESFGSLFGRGTGEVVLEEIRALRNMGLNVGLICHGSDIRSPDAFVERHPAVSLEDFGDGVDRLRRAAAEGARVLESFDGHVFVSTPDLLHDIPNATLLPVVVDPHPWEQASAGQVHARDVPLVLHIPSNMGIKGSVHVNRIAEALHTEGIIEYRQLQGVDPGEMPELIAGADIVIDQMLLGSYGVAACEAMAAGRVVVSNVFDDVRQAVRAGTGYELPIIQADSDTLDRVLRELVSNPEAWTSIGVKSQEFVRTVHSGSRTLPALAKFLGTSTNRAQDTAR